MNRLRRLRFSSRHLLGASAGLVVIGFVLHGLLAPAYGAELGNRQLKLDNNNAGALATYALSFDLSTAGTLGSIEVQFCSNDPLFVDPCDPPAGFTDLSASLSAQTGQTGFSVSGSSTANELILTRPPAAADAGPVSYTLSGVTNPPAPGAYYVRVQTFASADASGAASDYGGIAFDILGNVSVSAEVPPYIIFCTGLTIPGDNCANAQGDYINFGELSSQHSSSGSSQMLAATNAQDGYSISVFGTTLESGNNVIAALTNNDVSRPGTAQFGLNLRANASPSIGQDPGGAGGGDPTANYDQPNFYRFDPNDVVASYDQPENARLFTASYIVNVPPDQAPGIYVATMTYICLANF